MKKAISILLLLVAPVLAFAQTNEQSREGAPTHSPADNHEIFAVVDKTAEPVGGMVKLYEFIAQNLRYPVQARAHGVEGKVFVEFVVEKDGSITHPKTIAGIGGGCNEEAERVVGLFPDWLPAENDGRPARQKFVLPINFKLTEPRKNRDGNTK